MIAHLLDYIEVKSKHTHSGSEVPALALFSTSVKHKHADEAVDGTRPRRERRPAPDRLTDTGDGSTAGTLPFVELPPPSPGSSSRITQNTLFMFFSFSVSQQLKI